MSLRGQFAARIENLSQFEAEQQRRLAKLTERSMPVTVQVSRASIEPETDGKPDKKVERRPFLKRGQGLARFRMQIDPERRKSDPVARPRFSTQTPPSKQLSSEPSRLENTKQAMNTTGSAEKSPNRTNDSKVMMQDYSTKLDDLQVFEILEQKVANSSFCSNSSSIDVLFNGANYNGTGTVQSFTPYRYFSPKKRVSYDRKFNYDSKASDEHLKTLNEELLHENTLEFSADAMISAEAEAQSDACDAEDAQSSRDGVVYVQDVQIQCDLIGERGSSLTCENRSRDLNLAHESGAAGIAAKTSELDREMRILQQENDRVLRLKTTLETEKKNFQRERERLKKTRNDEFENLRIEYDSEKVKFANQKYLLESKVKELKKQVASLKKNL